jgi:hypothetical protein
MTFSNSLLLSASGQPLYGSLLPISESAHTVLQGASGLKCGIYQEPNVQLRKRMLDQRLDVAWKGTEGRIPTLAGQQTLGDIAVLELTLKP